jgi:hypothetical protein
MADVNSNTVDGLLAFCDYLVDKGFGTSSQVEPWKTAIKKVFSALADDDADFGSMSLDGVDVEEYMGRFRRKTAGQYKPDSITAYGSRLARAIEAHAYFREHNRPPTFRQSAVRAHGGSDVTAGSSAGRATRRVQATAGAELPQPAGPEFFDLDYPLESGHMASLRLPKRMSKQDVDRLSTVLRTLEAEEQRQIPEHTGEPVAA